MQSKLDMEYFKCIKRAGSVAGGFLGFLGCVFGAIVIIENTL
jgi:hypothetical protein